ncbi:unnamed protein product [Echinostoma caproni]|uniref:PEHE domain-containing protein n=1 Tax=Echinostoma caproni TaxID=27848 RepID=A0A183BA72_9TREM|nr:unnamed protein product [Echinostoma caproni]
MPVTRSYQSKNPDSNEEENTITQANSRVVHSLPVSQFSSPSKFDMYCDRELNRHTVASCNRHSLRRELLEEELDLELRELASRRQLLQTRRESLTEVPGEKMNEDSSEVKSTNRRQQLADNSTGQTDANSAIDEGMVHDTVEAINTTSPMVTDLDASRECVIQDHPISSACVPTETSLKQWRQLADPKLHKVGHKSVPLQLEMNFPKAHRAIQK